MAAISMTPSIFNSYTTRYQSVGLNRRRFHMKYAEGFLWTQSKSRFDVCCQSGIFMDPTKSVRSVLDPGHVILTEPDNGIGITKILRGKTLLATGATGYLGKAFLEKILRAIPDVRKIYIMVKAESKEAAMARLNKEILESGIFKCLQQQHGESYLAFMLSKIVPVIGNVGETNLGLGDDTEDIMEKEVQIIINCAADTSYGGRYDTMLDINTHGAKHMINFAKKCRDLILFMHVSTAFVHGKQDGIFIEKPVAEGVSLSGTKLLAVENEMKLLLEAKKGSDDEHVLSQKLKQFGLDRAHKHGWQSTYTLTKAMGERMIDTLKGDLPVVVIRPACIESTFREPFPGWIEKIRLLDPVILFYGKGQLTGFVAEPGNDPDIVPLDMVVNAMLAAVAVHAVDGNPKNLIYQVASSVSNTIAYKDLMELFYNHFKSSPIIESNGTPIHIRRMKLLRSMEEFYSHYSEEQAISGNDPTTIPKAKSNRKIFEQLQRLNIMYKEMSLCNARFDCTNTKALLDCMSMEEKQLFGFDVTDVDWKEYIENIHIPGFRRHVMKGRLG